MSLFRNQPGFCCICGARDEYPYTSQQGVKRAILCSMDCTKEWDRRFALYVMGKEFHPASAPSVEGRDDGR